MMHKMIVVKYLAVILSFVGSIHANSKLNERAKMEEVKNIILFIGDGMGTAHVTAASYKLFGVNGRLAMEKFPVVGFVRTHAADKLITDSASGATALATGYKTNVGMIGITPDSLKKATILEAAMSKGMRTGIIATSHITDATPSSFIAHVPHRSMQNEIAEQMISSRLDVILGGGKSRFIPQTQEHSEREDDKNLILEAIDSGFTFIDSPESLYACQSGKILGLFSKNGFEFTPDEPTLAEMTEKAMEILSKNNENFLLIVEGSQIDWRAHDNDVEGVIEQTKYFDDAVRAAKEFAENNKETLILVTADHETGGITLTDEHIPGEMNSGISWSTGGHTAVPVPVFAYGPASELFTGVLDNTDIAKQISALLNLDLNFNITVNFKEHGILVEK